MDDNMTKTMMRVRLEKRDRAGTRLLSVTATPIKYLSRRTSVSAAKQFGWGNSPADDESRTHLGARRRGRRAWHDKRTFQRSDLCPDT